jgi:hypothetical protein
MHRNGSMGLCYTDCDHCRVRNPPPEAASNLLTQPRVTYPVDCYEDQAGEVSLLINLGRNLFSFNVSFYIRPFTEKVGYAWAYGIWAILAVVLFFPVIGLMVWGRRWRHELGTPRLEHA